MKDPSAQKEMNKDMEKIMREYRESQRREKEELAAQTWPTWLPAKDFEKWYVDEQEYRRGMGMTMLPNPPGEIVQEILSGR